MCMISVFCNIFTFEDTYSKQSLIIGKCLLSIIKLKYQDIIYLNLQRITRLINIECHSFCIQEIYFFFITHTHIHTHCCRHKEIYFQMSYDRLCLKSCMVVNLIRTQIERRMKQYTKIAWLLSLKLLLSDRMYEEMLVPFNEKNYFNVLSIYIYIAHKHCSTNWCKNGYILIVNKVRKNFAANIYTL